MVSQRPTDAVASAYADLVLRLKLVESLLSRCLIRATSSSERLATKPTAAELAGVALVALQELDSRTATGVLLDEPIVAGIDADALRRRIERQREDERRLDRALAEPAPVEAVDEGDDRAPVIYELGEFRVYGKPDGITKAEARVVAAYLRHGDLDAAGREVFLAANTLRSHYLRMSRRLEVPGGWLLLVEELRRRGVIAGSPPRVETPELMEASA